ncbi:MAG TPA: molybdopterin-dependent oxidoreductase [Blastocatellia bacterium]|nr:molybdopterin-dependent oxidoreductase [Blastocatellia bacterium]
MEILRLNINRDEPQATQKEIRLQVALVAAIATVAASLIARFVFGAPLVPELLAQWFFSVAPIWMVEAAVGLLGPFAKHLGFLAAVVVYLIALTAAAFGFLQVAPPRRAALGGFAASVYLFTLILIIPILGGGVAGRYLRQGALATSIALLLTHAVYAASLMIAAHAYLDADKANVAQSKLLSRRRVVRGIGYTALAIGVYDIGQSLFGSWLNRGAGRVRNGTGEFPFIDNLALEVTPAKDFYVVSKNAFDPEVDATRWRLEIAGLVETPIRLTYDDLKSMPAVEQYATLCCISNEVGGDLIGNALWRGVRLKDLLQKAGVRPGVVDIALRASDDYLDSIPLDRAMQDGTLLVYEMNGEPLTPAHGYPLRLLVPGIYGMKNVKWITRLEAIDYDLKGYWQRRGWDDRAEYKTMSRIDAPAGNVKGEASIAGVAFAGDRGISKVEVSTDGGATWEPAEIKPALSPFTWVLWQKRWTAQTAGKHRLVVRATDGRGNLQSSQYAPPEPSGSSGYDAKTVTSQ